MLNGSSQGVAAKRCIKITTKDGLSSAFSKKIFEDSNGYIWICTQDGLNRYDGKDFLIYRKDAPEGFRLLGNDINDIVEDTLTHKLWVISSSGGISGIDTKTYKVTHSERLVSKVKSKVIWLKNLAIQNSILWLGTDEGLFRYQPADHKFTFIVFPWNANQGFYDIDALASDEKNSLWIGFANGLLACLDLQNLKIIFKDDRFYDKTYNPSGFLTFSSIQVKSDNEVLIASSAGLFSIFTKEKIKVKEHTLPFLTSDHLPIYAASFVARTYWVATAQGIYSVFPDGSWKLVIDNVLGNTDNWYRRTIHIYEDKAKNIWLSVPNGAVFVPALHHFFESYFIANNSNAKINRCYSLFPMGTDAVYVGGDDGLYKVNTFNHSIHKYRDNQAVFYLDTLANGDLLACKMSGVKIMVKNEWQPVSKRYPYLRILDTLSINSFVCFGDSLVYFCPESAGEILEWRIKENKLQPLLTNPYNISNNGLLNCVKKLDDYSFFILGDDAFYRYYVSSKKIQMRQVKTGENNIKAKYYFDIAGQNEKFYLALYEEGVLELDTNLNFIKKLNPFNNNAFPGVYKVVPFNDSILFVTTNNGLYIFNTHNASDGSSVIYETHGLQTHQFEEGCAIFSNGKIYAGGINGFQIIDPDIGITKFSYKKPMLNEAILYYRNRKKETRMIGNKALEISPGNINVQLSVSMPEIMDASNILYEYRLRDDQDEWIKNGNQKTISLSELATGTYSFQVRANTSLHGTHYSRAVQMIFLPPWYQTTWFYALCILAAGGIAYALYRYRLWQIHKEYRFKEKIAADLHDDLGSTITGIKMFTELGVSTGSAQYYAPVKQGLTDAALALREMIWVLDNKSNTAANILRKIESNCLPLLREKGISFTLHQDPKLEKLNMKTDEKRDIYLLLKEFVNNSVKYAECNNITLEAEMKSNRMKLEIRDNGKGFEMGKVKHGNGLYNMEMRAKRCRYELSLTSVIGKGSTLELLPR